MRICLAEVCKWLKIRLKINLCEEINILKLHLKRYIVDNLIF